MQEMRNSWFSRIRNGERKTPWSHTANSLHYYCVYQFALCRCLSVCIMPVSITECERNFSISFVQRFQFEHCWLHSTVRLWIGFRV